MSFTSRAADVTEIDVRCHVGEGTGASSVVISDAGPGPCKVVGRRDGPSLVAVVSLTGPADFECFADGSRSCR